MLLAAVLIGIGSSQSCKVDGACNLPDRSKDNSLLQAGLRKGKLKVSLDQSQMSSDEPKSVLRLGKEIATENVGMAMVLRPACPPPPLCGCIQGMKTETHVFESEGCLSSTCKCVPDKHQCPPPAMCLCQPGTREERELFADHDCLISKCRCVANGSKPKKGEKKPLDKLGREVKVEELFHILEIKPSCPPPPVCGCIPGMRTETKTFEAGDCLMSTCKCMPDIRRVCAEPAVCGCVPGMRTETEVFEKDGCRVAKCRCVPKVEMKKQPTKKNKGVVEKKVVIGKLDNQGEEVTEKELSQIMQLMPACPPPPLCGCSPGLKTETHVFLAGDCLMSTCNCVPDISRKCPEQALCGCLPGMLTETVKIQDGDCEISKCRCIPAGPVSTNKPTIGVLSKETKEVAGDKVIKILHLKRECPPPPVCGCGPGMKTETKIFMDGDCLVSSCKCAPLIQRKCPKLLAQCRCPLGMFTEIKRVQEGNCVVSKCRCIPSCVVSNDTRVIEDPVPLVLIPEIGTCISTCSHSQGKCPLAEGNSWTFDHLSAYWSCLKTCCEDYDAQKIMDGLTCEDLKDNGVNCDDDLNEVFSGQEYFVKGTPLSSICPKTCGVCCSGFSMAT